MDTSSVESLSMPLSSRAQKKLEKVQCLKCGEFGHFADACMVVLCVYCEKITHESKDCPLLSMPKPVAITYGVCRNQLMFHEVPASPEVTFKHDSGKVGKISILGGTMTAQEIVHELHWIISGNHQWDLQPSDDGAFKAIFPSKADFARMIKIVKVPVPESDMFLHFEEWLAADLDMFYLTPVWVRVHGVCYKERCDYLSLFGVGSLIGKTKEVDMVFTRSNSLVRMLVEVTRAEHIPTTTVDHLYDGKGYGLIFKRESDLGKEKSDIVMYEAAPGDDSSKEDGNGKLPKDADSSSGGPAASTPAPPLDTSKNPIPSKKAGGSMPVLRVRLIDCPSPIHLIGKPMSDTKVALMRPRKLWGDSADEDDDGLPSPLPRLFASGVGSDVAVCVSSPAVQVVFDADFSVAGCGSRPGRENGGFPCRD
jgi:hypothetical protein